MDEKSFRQQLSREGYGDIDTVTMAPNTRNDTHIHDFSASAMVLSGEITVTTEDGATTCRADDLFALEAGVPHAESVGPEGVSLLLGRK